MSEIPFRPPAGTCNARLYRSKNYCDLDAGKGTNHPGMGRCKLHGGNAGGNQDGVDGPLDLFKAAGFTQIIDMAETMTMDDAEYLMGVGNNALIVTRTKILAKLQHPDIGAKEMADLTIALQRVDAILAKYPDEENPDRASSSDGKSATDLELERILELEGSGQ